MSDIQAKDEPRRAHQEEARLRVDLITHALRKGIASLAASGLDAPKIGHGWEKLCRHELYG